MFGLDTAFVIWLLPLSFAGFVLTSVAGLGSAIFLVPVLMMRMEPAYAVSLAAPITLVGNLSRAWLLRDHVDKRAAWIVVVTSAPTSLIAALFVMTVNANVLKLSVAVLVIVTVGTDVLRARFVTLGPKGLGIAGAVSGVLSGLAGLAGPPGALAMRAYGLAGEALVATLSVWGIALQALKIPAYVAAGAMPFSLLPLAIVLTVLSWLGAVIATRLVKGMPGEAFRRLLNAVLCGIAVWLLLDVLLRRA